MCAPPPEVFASNRIEMIIKFLSSLALSFANYVYTLKGNV